jgi:hypothetical protein
MRARETAARPDMSRKTRLRLLVGTAAVVPVLAALAFSFDLMHLHADAVADEVRGSGALGPLALIALLVAQAVVAPLPSPPILMAAGFVYGPWIGFAIGWFGLLLGASACFGLARAFGRPLAERFVSPERLATVDRYVGKRSGETLLTSYRSASSCRPPSMPSATAAASFAFPSAGSRWRPHSARFRRSGASRTSARRLDTPQAGSRRGFFSARRED